jgi:hypothetical protein
VEPTALLPFAAWESFYVIIGSSAAALTGLQFVVIVLGAEVGLGSAPTNRAFGTPTIVHFGAVLLLSAILSAPWHRLPSAGLCLTACGIAGLAYGVNVIRHARRQTDYKPVLEDWLWHFTLPLIAYAALTAAAVTLQRHPEPSLFAVGGVALLLLFVGIHNAWDSVTYIALERRRPEGAGERDQEPRGGKPGEGPKRRRQR